MPINRFYHTWMERIRQLFPRLHLPQQRNLAWVLVGVYLSRSVALSRIAGKMPGPAKRVSRIRRLERFVDNPTLHVRPLYRPLAQAWLAFAAQQGRIRLIIDATRVGSGHQLLMVALAFRKRAIPIAWTWLRCKKGHSSVKKQVALLAYVQGLLPATGQVILVGDTEFEAGDLQKQLAQWGWQYVLRQKANNQVQPEPGSLWQRFGDLAATAGQSRWLEQVLLTSQHRLRVNVLAHWQIGEKEAWLLATNLPACRETLRAYRYRMWIEEMFGDLKDHGFDLEATRLRYFCRLSRLTLAVALLYTWLLTCGVQTVKNGLRSLVDRKDRRDLSYFQIGYREIERRLIDQLHVFIRLSLLPIQNVSGS